MSPTFPEGAMSYISHESTRLTAKSIAPKIQYGISFAIIKSHFVTGVTFICSMVPTSFSPTILSAGKKPQIIMSGIPNKMTIVRVSRTMCFVSFMMNDMNALFPILRNLIATFCSSRHETENFSHIGGRVLLFQFCR